ncbi:hypothetical protein BRADI_1g46420v3 [Brachypodium distachyon]|uniref:Ubiquitin-like protein ATG12 n=1 Tax=Brachypodium distachyon TaxID=15368 RepID=I1H002_BRADI|nr:hypothetical protein BRADI_1g46420v3 [Brachypodium distachyon]
MAAEPNQKKVVVNFQSVANAPKLRQSKFKIGGNEKFAKFLYVNSVFSPNPDELINDLYSGRSNALITFMFPAILS